MSSGQWSRNKRLNLILIIVLDLAIINTTWSFEETCVNVKSRTFCYFNGVEAEYDWDAAWQLCHSRNSTLPDIRNRNEQDVFAKFLNEHMSGSVVWTSGRNYTLDDWKWLDGRSYSGQDASALSRRPERYQPMLYIDFRIRDVERPDYPLHYICQYPGAKCSYFKDMASITNGCIRESVDIRSWYDARNQCLMDGGDLAVPRNEDRDILRKYLTNSEFWIGLRKSSWRWNPNENAGEEDEIKYTNWSEDWNPLTGDCISINASDGKWKAIECSEQLQVVCQREVSLPQDVVNRTSSKSETCEALLSASYLRESQSVSQATFLYVVVAGICAIVLSNVSVAMIVRKCVLQRSSPATTIGEAFENPRYQDLETIKRQANTNEVYTELKLQPDYEDVSRRGQ